LLSRYVDKDLPATVNGGILLMRMAMQKSGIEVDGPIDWFMVRLLNRLGEIYDTFITYTSAISLPWLGLSSRFGNEVYTQCARYPS